VVSGGNNKKRRGATSKISLFKNVSNKKEYVPVGSYSSNFSLRKFPLIVSLIIIAIILWYYFIYSMRPMNPTFINAVFAFSSTIILGLSFFLGPLSSLINYFKKFLGDRKTYGLVGFVLATVHVLISILIMLNSEREMTFSDVGSLAFAAMAFIIFLLMALTSTQNWMNKLGFENWKNLQRTGYFAFVFLLAHIAIIRQGFFMTIQMGQFVLVFGIFILMLRAIVLVINVIKK
jgi:DMSO/TMAO reductase YedYZ heme-binding membrane subunit